MPLSGGATDKFGNRYEGLWTIDCMIDLIDEQADIIQIESIPLNDLNEQATTIRLEPPGEEGEGVEFWLQRGKIREYHQVKRQKSKGEWTISSLEAKDIQVFSNFQRKLSQPSSHCVFISSNSASEIKELSDRARDSQTWSEFASLYLSKEWTESFSKLCSKWSIYENKIIQETIGAFQQQQTLSNEQSKILQVAMESYKKLQRFYIKTIDEDSLRQKIESRLRSLIEKKSNDLPSHEDWKTAVSILAEFALENIHQELTANDIWKRLDERGYQPRNYSKSEHILIAIQKANQLYLSPLEKQTAIAGQSIPREEVQEALNSLLKPENRKGVLLVGDAGVGKSGVVFQIAKELQNKSINFFAFRIDNLQPEINPDDVGKKYGLPLSPAIVLGNISKNQNRDWVLIIDQLDAVSQASGRNPEFFDCIAAIIEQTLQFSRVYVLVACRQFDLNNDSRIRNLTGENGILESVEVRKLAEYKVIETVKQLRIDNTKLNQKQIELLSLPLHLYLLSEIYQNSNIETLDFETVNDIFNKFWEFKQRKCRARVDNSIHWTNVIDKLCYYMNLQQSLSAPKSVVDEYFIYAEIMISENILIQEDNNLRFFHETFFDYAFARRFTERGNKLLSFLRADEQHLFKRAQIRQILHREREINFDQYLDDLDELLNSEDIRFHIKQLIIALLSNLPNPKQEEWDIIKPLIKKTDSSLFNHAWSLLYQPKWFMLAKNLGIIEQWLRDDNDLIVNKTVHLISFIVRELPDELPPLIEPFIEELSEKWLNRLLFIGERISSQLDHSRKLLDFFLALLDKGKLDRLRDTFVSNGDFWTLIYSLSEKNSAWTCEVISHYLNRRLELYLLEVLLLHFSHGYCLKLNPSFLKHYASIKIALNPFDRKYDKGNIPNTQYTQIFIDTANKASKDYIINLLPFMLSVVELGAIKNDEKPWKDKAWYYRSYGEGYEIDNAILNGMEIALSNLAKNNPEEFYEIIQEYNLSSSPFETTQFLLVRAYTANGSRFADEAAEYLYKKSYRLKTGYDICSGNAEAAKFWATRQLLKTITPHCSPDNLIHLEQTILNYYPKSKWEKNPDFRALQGYAQLVLLDGIEPSRRNLKVTKRLQELNRKFTSINILEETEKIESPKSIEVYIVGSPIPENATAKMTDEQWLEAIKTYNYSDGGPRFQQTGELIGGAVQLSDNLKKEVIKDPYRFAKLIHKFPDNANPAYFNSILRGISETEVKIDVETALSVCQHCHQLQQKPCGRDISWLFQKLAHLSWSSEALDIITYYALYDPDPKQELWRTKASGETMYYGGDILTAGINSVRGSAVQAISQLIFKDKERAAYLQDVLEKIVRDFSIAVRSCAAEMLTVVLNYNRDLAVKLFKQLVATEDILLSTQTVDRFLYYALQTHYTELISIVERMINSEMPEVQEIGARQLFLVSLINSEAQSLAKKYLLGTSAHRKAAALIYSANLHSADYREICEKVLSTLFYDDDKVVQEQASKCFLDLKPQNLNNSSKLIEDFINSPAFLNNSYPLIRLFRYTKRDDLDTQIVLTSGNFSIAFKICKRFVEIAISEASDRLDSYSTTLNDISQIIVQIYSQPPNSTLQSDCLDIIDKLYRYRAYGIDNATKEYER